MLLTVSVYVPRPPLVLNAATPLVLVVAVCAAWLPSGRVHVACTCALATTLPFSSFTVTLPLTVTRLTPLAVSAMSVDCAADVSWSRPVAPMIGVPR